MTIRCKLHNFLAFYSTTRDWQEVSSQSYAAVLPVGTQCLPHLWAAGNEAGNSQKLYPTTRRIGLCLSSLAGGFRSASVRLWCRFPTRTALAFDVLLTCVVVIVIACFLTPKALSNICSRACHTAKNKVCLDLITVQSAIKASSRRILLFSIYKKNWAIDATFTMPPVQESITLWCSWWGPSMQTSEDVRTGAGATRNRSASPRCTVQRLEDIKTAWQSC